MSWYRRLERKQVVITTKGGTTYRGYIVDGDRHTVLLTQVELLSSAGDPVDMKGVAVVLKDQITEPIQIPGGNV